MAGIALIDPVDLISRMVLLKVVNQSDKLSVYLHDDDHDDHDDDNFLKFFSFENVNLLLTYC